MHTTGIVIASWIAIALSAGGVMLPVEWVMVGLLASVALVGLPHGCLDHWSGKRLLLPLFRGSWWMVFFPVYLLIALLVAAGWFLAPLLTAISFFLLSAWHFGHEERADESHSALGILDSVASGGLVIWIPVLFRPDDVGQILRSLVTGDLVLHVRTILLVSQCIAVPLTLCAFAFMVIDVRRGYYLAAVRKLSFVIVFCFVDVLISFGIYFCGWHSVRGLKRLANENRLSASQLLMAVAPLTIGAIVLSLLGLWVWSSGLTSVESWHRTLFISLSAMAVPHLVLHGPISHFLDHIPGVPRSSQPLERTR